jgi:hypothetical protein
MARKITSQAVDAFVNGFKFRSGNTNVDVQNWDGGKVVKMYLHGNLIAERFTSTGVTKVTNAGWFSNTTKERLNGVPNVSITQKNFVWYLNGVEWDGGLKAI